MIKKTLLSTDLLSEDKIYTKTMGGRKIVNFKKLEKPIDRGILDPLIFSGNVWLYPMEAIDIYWDKYGRCCNLSRSDCFVDINSI